MEKRFRNFGLLVVALGALAGGLFVRLPNRTDYSGVESPEIAANYSEALSVIEDNYVAPVDHEKVAESSIQGMLWALDPHSSFFNREELKKLYEEQSSRFFGIGVSILQHRDGVYVQSVVSGTPAEKAGLRYGDKFVEIDGKNSEKWTSAEVSKNVRGVRGSLVKIKIDRASEANPIEMELTRDGVPFPSVRNFFMLRDGTGYIGLTGGFQETTSEELDRAITELKKSGMKNLILDLRGNPGGLLPQAIEVSSRFIPRGQTIVSVKGRSRFSKSEDLRAVGSRVENFPLVVLINGFSASASEIVAGAIQDYGRGIIVGDESFGKGLVQRVFSLPAGTGMSLTTARYYTPFGRSLQRDYSSGSIYDYYNHQTNSDTNSKADANSLAPPKGDAVPTAGGRILYGGRGIEPDLKAPPLIFSPLRQRMNEAAFYFTRQLVAGKISGLEEFRVGPQKNIQTVRPDEFVVTDKILEAFKMFVLSDTKNGLSSENLKAQLDYAKWRIREELATATYSGEAGSQVLLENDPQVLKGLDSIPEAARMALSFQKTITSVG